MNTTAPIIAVKNLKIHLGGKWVHDDLNLTVQQGEILGIAGSSGSGKTVLLYEMLMLQRPSSGSICVFGEDLTTAPIETLIPIQQRWGVVFQQNALFSALTVLENIAFPLKERGILDRDAIAQLALQRILSVGLPIDAAHKYPFELSGGMKKRAALARAIVTDPEILFLDEPSTGLDPDSAAELDELILELQSILGLTIVIVTHDLDSLWHITNRVAFLSEGKILHTDEINTLITRPDTAIQKFFNGTRGRAIRNIYQ